MQDYKAVKFSRKNYLVFNLILLFFIFLIVSIYLSQIILFTKYNLEIQKFENSLQVLHAENDYLNKKIADENTAANLFETSQKLGLVKIGKPEYIMTTEEIFVAK